MTPALEDYIGFLLYRTERSMRRVFIEVLKKGKPRVTPEEWGVLHRLWEKDGRTQQGIADSTFRDKANIARVVESLEKKGLLIRRPDPDDRRAKRLYCTQKGRDLKQKLMPHLKEAIDRTFQGIQEDDIEATRRVLTRLYTNIHR